MEEDSLEYLGGGGTGLTSFLRGGGKGRGGGGRGGLRGKGGGFGMHGSMGGNVYVEIGRGMRAGCAMGG